MPPISDISYRASRKGYHTYFRGRLTVPAKGPDDKPTGPTHLAAPTKFREVMRLANADCGRGPKPTTADPMATGGVRTRVCDGGGGEHPEPFTQLSA